MKVFSFKNIRITVLLSILAVAAIYTKEQRLQTTSWYKPLEVIIFPINGDGSTATDHYLQQLTPNDFQDIDDFFVRGAKQYNLITEQPIITTLGSSLTYLPPAPPHDRKSVLHVMLWSMKLRYWAYKNTPDTKSNKNRIRLYVLYHQGLDNQPLAHSLGIQKGLIGVIHAFANDKQNQQNSIIMAHEILHTVGASDKYDRNNLPVYPDGYAQPEQTPLYPQRFAEIMAGRIPISNVRAQIPASLRHVIVGERTAKEINWITAP
ncbi:MAG: hypothetical protein OEW97_06075 [Gammaproteobacteria bacterium]|nr:hypothetical protein [Gammaproteobacteria bacterium]